ncbi:hypothetical protein E2P81_ATG04680 [Venturia nashicola]|nr:hypothetical protein E2P81_ATG04680 [Venturia nashicola]
MSLSPASNSCRHRCVSSIFELPRYPSRLSNLTLLNSNLILTLLTSNLALLNSNLTLLTLNIPLTKSATQWLSRDRSYRRRRISTIPKSIYGNGDAIVCFPELTPAVTRPITKGKNDFTARSFFYSLSEVHIFFSAAILISVFGILTDERKLRERESIAVTKAASKKPKLSAPPNLDVMQSGGRSSQSIPPSAVQHVEAISQQSHMAKATTAGLSAEEEAARRGEDADKEMSRIIADLEVAKAEHKARKKEKKASLKAAKALAALADAKKELAELRRKAKARETPVSESDGSIQPDSQSTKASAKAFVPPTVPGDLISIATETEKVDTTGFYCGRCKQNFKSATHLQAMVTHFLLTEKHIVCTWTFKMCAKLADFIVEAGTLWMRKHQNINNGCQPFIKDSDRSIPYTSSASAFPQHGTELVARPRLRQTPASARSMPQKPQGGDQAPMNEYQISPRPTDNYKKEPPKYRGPPQFGSMQPTEYPQAQMEKSSFSSTNVSFALPTPLFKAFAGLPKALSDGTAKYAWLEYPEEELDVTNRYQTITRMDGYKQWSLEELRYGDYEKGTKYGPVKAPRREPPAPLPSIPSVHPPSRVQATVPAANAQLAFTDKIGCWSCSRQFSKTFSMISHLEAGCSRGPNHYDFHNAVARSDVWKQFIYRDDRYNMLKRRDWEYECPFFCPCCRGDFARLSGLIDHIENRRCDQSLDSDPLPGILNWIQSQVI